jgi:hypothetical protein
MTYTVTVAGVQIASSPTRSGIVALANIYAACRISHTLPNYYA